MQFTNSIKYIVSLSICFKIFDTSTVMKIQVCLLKKIIPIYFTGKTL